MGRRSHHFWYHPGGGGLQKCPFQHTNAPGLAYVFADHRGDHMILGPPQKRRPKLPWITELRRQGTELHPLGRKTRDLSHLFFRIVFRPWRAPFSPACPPPRPPFPPFCFPLGSLWFPLGSLWAPFGFPLGSLCVPLGSASVPCGSHSTLRRSPLVAISFASVSVGSRSVMHRPPLASI